MNAQQNIIYQLKINQNAQIIALKMILIYMNILLNVLKNAQKIQKF